MSIFQWDEQNIIMKKSFLYKIRNFNTHLGCQAANCFRLGTPILLADKISYKPIEQIEIGDKISAFSKLGEVKPTQVINLIQGKTNEWVELSYNDIKLYATPTHEFLLQDGNFKTLKELIAQAQGGHVESEYNDIKPIENTDNYLELVDIEGNSLKVKYKLVPVNSHVTYNLKVEELDGYIAGKVRVCDQHT